MGTDGVPNKKGIPVVKKGARKGEVRVRQKSYDHHILDCRLEIIFLCLYLKHIDQSKSLFVFSQESKKEGEGLQQVF